VVQICNEFAPPKLWLYESCGEMLASLLNQRGNCADTWAPNWLSHVVVLVVQVWLVLTTTSLQLLVEAQSITWPRGWDWISILQWERRWRREPGAYLSFASRSKKPGELQHRGPSYYFTSSDTSHE